MKKKNIFYEFYTKGRKPDAIRHIYIEKKIILPVKENDEYVGD